VLVVNARDSVRSIIRPRLRVAAADLDKIKTIGAIRHGRRKCRPNLHREIYLRQIRRAVEAYEIALVVYDAVTEVAEGRVSELSTLADETGGAVLLIPTYKRRRATDPCRTGSQSGLIVAAHPDRDRPGEMVLARRESPLAPAGWALSYRIKDVAVE